MQLAKLRKERGITQQELANKIGVSRSLISLVELGFSRPYPSLKKRIAKALNFSEEQIFGGEKQKAG